MTAPVSSLRHGFHSFSPLLLLIHSFSILLLISCNAAAASVCHSSSCSCHFGDDRSWITFSAFLLLPVTYVSSSSLLLKQLSLSCGRHSFSSLSQRDTKSPVRLFDCHVPCVWVSPLSLLLLSLTHAFYHRPVFA